MSLALQILKFEEGFRADPYYDHLGFPTIGYGRLLGKKGDNLPEITVTEKQEEIFVHDRIMRIVNEIPEHLEDLCEARRAILISMAYQIGVAGLKRFKSFLGALKRCDWELAEKHMLDSLWARQTPGRANRHADVIMSGSVLGVKEYRSFDE